MGILGHRKPLLLAVYPHFVLIGALTMVLVSRQVGESEGTHRGLILTADCSMCSLLTCTPRPELMHP